MIPLSPHEVAAAVSGVLHGVPDDAVGRTSITSVVADSRAVVPGALFVAIPGERVDGHDFAASAVGTGAPLVLCSRPLLDATGVDLPCVIVDDPVAALGALAAWYRAARLTCSVVAVTGSSGKTSTKDLIARVLAAAGPTVSPRGSFNTEVGLPLTVLQADASTRFLVLEMGMRGEGHIAYLAGLVRPDISVVLNVGSAHLGMLGSREAIARAKAEIIRDLPASATAVLNADDPLVSAMAGRTAAHIVRFGESFDARVRATDVWLDERARPRFTLVDMADAGADAVAATAPVHLLLSGRHHVSNALAAAAVGVVSGLSVQQVADALDLAVPDSRWRMEVSEAPGGCTVINDAYNANPESMRAALASLAAMAGGRRTWAVLGEMRELGDAAESAHAAVGSFAVQEGVARLVCVGEATIAMHRAACDEWARVAGSDITVGDGEPVLVPDPAAAIALLTAQVRPGDIVLVKASRSIGLEVVAEALLEADALPAAVREGDEVPGA